MLGCEAGLLPDIQRGTLAVRTKKGQEGKLLYFLRSARNVGHLKSVARQPAAQVRAELTAPTNSRNGEIGRGLQWDLSHRIATSTPTTST